MSLLATGQKFGRYRVHRYLGTGVSGESYEAEDIAQQRVVTLKLIHPWSPLPDSARRQFFREMQDICTFDHPSLAPFHDYGELNSRLFVARRYVESGSLLNREERDWYHTPMALSDALPYIDQLAQALMYIHSRNYFHGSLTFSNILAPHKQSQSTEQQTVPLLLISDLDLAYFVRRFGKPPAAFFPVTAAPEQFSGNTVQASDQYALAVVLYFWLTNRLPFVGTPETVEQLKRSGTITSPSLIEPTITPEQSNVILRALSVSPTDRYDSVLHFIDALRTSTQAQSSSKETTQVHNTSYSTSPAPPGRTSILPPSSPPIAPQQVTPDLQADQHTPPEQQEARTPYLIITGRDVPEPREIKLTRTETTIGRAGSSDIPLEYDELASRHQAMIKFENGRYILYDCLSANGTTLNGHKLESEIGYTLHHGDLIGIGIHDLTFVLK